MVRRSNGDDQKPEALRWQSIRVCSCKLWPDTAGGIMVILSPQTDNELKAVEASLKGSTKKS